MNREIKFRIWDKNLKAFIANTLTIGLNGELYMAGYNKHGDPSIILLANQDNYIISQFTGLLDCTGKEIYEGDIINYKYSSKEKNKIIIYVMIVVFHEEKFILQDRNEKNTFSDLFYAVEILLGKVIGNIFENPALLDNEK